MTETTSTMPVSGYNAHTRGVTTIASPSHKVTVSPPYRGLHEIYAQGLIGLFDDYPTDDKTIRHNRASLVRRRVHYPSIIPNIFGIPDEVCIALQTLLGMNKSWE